jgi:ABC-type transport system substrate-binding protein
MRKAGTIWLRAAALSFAALLASCAEIKTPETKPFYAESQPPAVSELRWSNGARPKTLDPALGGAAP